MNPMQLLELINNEASRAERSEKQHIVRLNAFNALRQWINEQLSPPSDNETSQGPIEG